MHKIQLDRSNLLRPVSGQFVGSLSLHQPHSQDEGKANNKGQLNYWGKRKFGKIISRGMIEVISIYLYLCTFSLDRYLKPIILNPPLTHGVPPTERIIPAKHNKLHRIVHLHHALEHRHSGNDRHRPLPSLLRLQTVPTSRGSQRGHARKHPHSGRSQLSNPNPCPRGIGIRWE